MKLCRFDNDRLGLVEGDVVRDVTAALDILPRHAYPLPRHDPLVAGLITLRLRIESLAADAPRRPLAGIKLLSPIANPGKILAAPVNYRKPAQVRGQLHRPRPLVRDRRRDRGPLRA